MLTKVTEAFSGGEDCSLGRRVVTLVLKLETLDTSLVSPLPGVPAI